MPEQQRGGVEHAHVVCRPHRDGLLPQQVWLHPVVLRQGAVLRKLLLRGCISGTRAFAQHSRPCVLLQICPNAQLTAFAQSCPRSSRTLPRTHSVTRNSAVQVVGIVGNLGLPWAGAFGIICAVYFYSHYLFASGAAHIGAMYTAFLSVATACGAPALPAALMLAQLSNLMGCLTPYGIGSAPPYFGAGYVPQVRLCPCGHPCSPVVLLAHCSLVTYVRWHRCCERSSILTMLQRSGSMPQVQYGAAPASTRMCHKHLMLFDRAQDKWYIYGFVCSVLYLFTWFVIGGAWWKFIGLL